MEEITVILNEASKRGLEAETRRLATKLMVGYTNYLNLSAPTESITNHSMFYQMALNLLSNDRSVPRQPPTESNDVSDVELIGDYTEYAQRLSDVAEEISLKDELDNAKLIAANNPTFDNVFIISDVWSMFMYYELIYELELYDSPIMLLATSDFNVESVPADSNIYILGWHPTTHSENIIKKLLQCGHDVRDITKLETIGIQTMEPCMTVPMFNFDDPTVWANSYGFGRPSKTNKYSESLNLILQT
jgi:hypothetical protein